MVPKNINIHWHCQSDFFFTPEKKNYNKNKSVCAEQMFKKYAKVFAFAVQQTASANLFCPFNFVNMQMQICKLCILIVENMLKLNMQSVLLQSKHWYNARQWGEILCACKQHFMNVDAGRNVDRSVNQELYFFF